MKLVDRPPKACYNQNRRMKFPKRSLALFLVFALLFSTNGSYSAQEDDPHIVVGFEPIENTGIAQVIEPENAYTAEHFGIDWMEPASAVDFAAAANFEWKDIFYVADLSEYNIQYGDYHLLYVSFTPFFGVGVGLPFDMMAGQARPISFVPYWHTNPDAVLFSSDTGFVTNWDIPGFEGIQWKSSNESICQTQYFQLDIDEGKKNPTLIWLIGKGEGTAAVQLVLPGGIIVQHAFTIAPRPPAYPRPLGFLVNPSIVRLTAGQTASAALTCLPEEGVDGKLVLADWVSSNPAVATLDNPIITTYTSLAEIPGGPLGLRVVGRGPGTAVISVYVAAYNAPFVLSGLDIYSFEVIVTAPSSGGEDGGGNDGGGDDGDDGGGETFVQRAGEFLEGAWDGIVDVVQSIDWDKVGEMFSGFIEISLEAISLLLDSCNKDDTTTPTTPTATKPATTTKPASSLSISGVMEISNPLAQGRAVPVQGTISSNYNITSVKVEIRQGSTTTKEYGETKYPNTKTYSLNTEFNNILMFSRLPLGNYTFYVEAKDESNTTKTYSKSFTVSKIYARVARYHLSEDDCVRTHPQILNNPIPSGFTSKNYELISATAMLNALRNSTVFIYRGDGFFAPPVPAYPYVYADYTVTNNRWVPNTMTTQDILDNIPSGALNHVNLVLYTACRTALVGSGGYSVVSATSARGAKCVIGFTDGTLCPQANTWTKEFMTRIAQGYTIEDAIYLAVAKVALDYNGNTGGMASRSWTGNANVIV